MRSEWHARPEAASRSQARITASLLADEVSAVIQAGGVALAIVLNRSQLVFVVREPGVFIESISTRCLTLERHPKFEVALRIDRPLADADAQLPEARQVLHGLLDGVVRPENVALRRG